MLSPTHVAFAIVRIYTQRDDFAILVHQTWTRRSISDSGSSYLQISIKHIALHNFGGQLNLIYLLRVSTWRSGRCVTNKLANHNCVAIFLRTLCQDTVWDTVTGPHSAVPFSVGTTRQKYKSGFGVVLNTQKKPFLINIIMTRRMREHISKLNVLLLCFSLTPCSPAAN